MPEKVDLLVRSSRDRFALEFPVIEHFAFHSLFAVGGIRKQDTLRQWLTVDAIPFGQWEGAIREHFYTQWFQFGFDTLRERHLSTGCSIVVSKQRSGFITRWPDHGHGFQVLGIPWQSAVVFQQNETLLCDFQRQLVVRRRIVFRNGNTPVGNARGRIELPQLETQNEQPAQRLIEFLFRDQSALQCLRQRLVCYAAAEVISGLDGHGARLGRVLDISVGLGLPDVRDAIDIADHRAAKAPFIAENIREQHFVPRGRNAIHGVVGTHQRFGIALADANLKGR